MSYSPLTDEQCDEFRRYNGSFNDMVRFIYSSGQLIERERCAKVCIKLVRDASMAGKCLDSEHDYVAAAHDCADAIRRGEQ